MWKDVLFPGDVTLPRGRVKFTPADMRHVADLCNEKIADGWRIPMCWEHQDDSLPVKLSAADKLANLAKHTFGEVRAFRVHQDRLQFLPEVYDQADRVRLNAAKHVSPQLRRDWLDSEGKLWPGLTIQHVAATPIPKQKLQNAFALSNAADSPLRIAAEDLIRLSEGSTVAKEDEGKGGEGDGGADAGFKRLLDALKANKLDPGEPKNLDELCVALEAIAATLHGEGEGDGNPNDLNQIVEGDTSGAPMTLSNAEAVAKMPAIQRKALERADSMTRSDLTGRLKKLVKSGRITPAIAAPLVAQVGKINLSFGEDGDVLPNAMINRIEAYEALPQNASWSKRGQRVNLSDADVDEGEPVHAPDKRPDESPAANKARQDAFDAMLTGRL